MSRMLPIPERSRLLQLIRRQRRGEMTAADEAEMRGIIATEFPQEAQTYSLDLAIQLGLGMTAVHYFFPQESGLHASA